MRGVCAARDCPYGEIFHYHHDGCPSCYEEDPTEVRGSVAVMPVVLFTKPHLGWVVDVEASLAAEGFNRPLLSKWKRPYFATKQKKESSSDGSVRPSMQGDNRDGSQPRLKKRKISSSEDEAKSASKLLAEAVHAHIQRVTGEAYNQLFPFFSSRGETIMLSFRFADFAFKGESAFLEQSSEEKRSNRGRRPQAGDGAGAELVSWIDLVSSMQRFEGSIVDTQLDLSFIFSHDNTRSVSGCCGY